MIRHLIWDLDGTLFDTYPSFTTAFLAALADWGHNPDPDEVFQLARVGLSFCASTLAATYHLPKSAVEGAFSHQYAQIPFYQQPLMPGAMELCAAFVRTGGVNLIVTGEDVTDYYRLHVWVVWPDRGDVPPEERQSPAGHRVPWASRARVPRLPSPASRESTTACTARGTPAECGSSGRRASAHSRPRARLPPRAGTSHPTAQ